MNQAPPFDPEEALLGQAAERRIFRLANPLGGSVLYDPAVVNHRIAEAEREGDSYRDLFQAMETAKQAVADGTPPDDPGVLAEQRRVMRGFARLGYAAFDQLPLEEDQRGGWTEAEAMGCLFAYMAWEASLRGKPAGSPPSSPPTDGLQASGR